MQRIATIILSSLICFCFTTGCSGKKGENSTQNGIFPYNLEKPDYSVFLPFEIEEISGLSYLKDDILASIQDEKGVIYTLDFTKEEIVQELKFGKNGDYEGVEIAGEYIYAVISDGMLYKTRLDATNTDTEVFDTPLSSKNDVEGLAYDAANNRLLLACKGMSGIEHDKPGSRAIYAFDLSTNQLLDEPVFLIETQAVNKLLEATFRQSHYRPSGIAVHPITGQIYIVASVGKVLIVLNKNGSIEAVNPLPSSLYKQPEGICFAPNGDMFISNEGKGGKATILRFNYSAP
jgi:uncharacterized protein YjiK